VPRFGTHLALVVCAMKISVECNWLNSRLSRISEFLICDEKAGRDPKILRLGILTTLSALFAIHISGCGYAFAPPKPPPPNVVVTIQPGAASLFLGQTQAFQATVTGDADTNVTWQVNAATGGSASTGTITAAGLFTAPAILPPGASVSVTAVSQVNPKDSASVIVTLKDNISISIAPTAATISVSAAQLFTATLTTGSGSPSTAITWAVNGVTGGNTTVGTIVANGSTAALYTAPGATPTPPTVTVTAISVADTTKSASASVTIACSGTNSISPGAANVALGITQNFGATFCPTATVAIVWDVNGIPGGNTTLGTIISTSSSTAQYTAPISLPTSNPVTVHAVAGSATVSAAVTIVSNVSVTVAPSATSVAINQRATLTPSVANTSNTAVTWSVNGISNGNAILGQICQHLTVPCVAPTGPASGAIDFLAPAAVPTSDPVTVTATSAADATRSGNAIVIITGPTGAISVSVSPAFAFIAPSTAALSQRRFYATVTGSSNTGVSWTVQSAVAGQGCTGAGCGSVDASGLYSAPTVAPSPNAISVIATSLADATKSATATVAITSGPEIEVILPSSVMAGAVESFPFSVAGNNFVPGSGGEASSILINGIPRLSTCPNTTTCSTALNPSDVQSAATLTIQIQNPPPLSQLSNPVPFVIVPFDASVGVITLTAGQPASTGTNIIVTEPTTAAASAPINVDFFGALTGGNTCEIQASPITVTRPTSGTSNVSLCVHGNLLDPTFTYVFTGPPGGDIAVTASAINGLFPNTIELDLQISSATLPGVRTLFITTLNNDRAAATAMIEVE
jgi:hypothetical protein